MNYVQLFPLLFFIFCSRLLIAQDMQIQQPLEQETIESKKQPPLTKFADKTKQVIKNHWKKILAVSAVILAFGIGFILGHNKPNKDLHKQIKKLIQEKIYCAVNYYYIYAECSKAHINDSDNIVIENVITEIETIFDNDLVEKAMNGKRFIAVRKDSEEPIITNRKKDTSIRDVCRIRNK